MNLPNEVWIQIFSFLELNDICKSIKLVCKTWNKYSLAQRCSMQISLLNIQKQPLDCLNKVNSIIQQVNQFSKTITKLELIHTLACNVHVTQLIQWCPRLTHLSIRDSERLGDNFLKQLSNSSIASNLQLLDIRGCRKVSNKGLEFIASKCLAIQKLYLQGCYKINDKGLDIVGKMNLIELDLRGLPNITDTGIVNVSSKCKNLRFLNLRQCYQLSSNAVQNICNSGYWSNLEHLVLKMCSQLDDEAIKTIAIKCTKLKILDIQCVTKVKEGVKYLKNLHNLNIMQCDLITDDGVVAIAKNNPNLTELQMKALTKLTDDAVVSVTKYCKALKILNLMETNVTNISVKAVLQNIETITLLNMTGCKKVPKSIAKTFHITDRAKLLKEIIDE